jgi:hypothetical protein
MSVAESVVERIEGAGGLLSLNGEHIRYRLPGDAAHLLGELRAHKAEVLLLLKRREGSGPRWPLESLDGERRFGEPHARLFRFIGRKVRTPEGAGTLVQVLRDRATVLLDRDADKCAWFEPGQIEPISWELSE